MYKIFIYTFIICLIFYSGCKDSGRNNEQLAGENRDDLKEQFIITDDLINYSINKTSSENVYFSKTYTLNGYFSMSFQDYWDSNTKASEGNTIRNVVENGIEILVLLKKEAGNEIPQMVGNKAKLTVFLRDKNGRSLVKYMDEYIKSSNESGYKIISRDSINVSGKTGMIVYEKSDWGNHVAYCFDLTDNLIIYIGVSYGDGTEKDKIEVDVLKIIRSIIFYNKL